MSAVAHLPHHANAGMTACWTPWFRVRLFGEASSVPGPDDVVVPCAECRRIAGVPMTDPTITDSEDAVSALVCTSCGDETGWLSQRGLCDHCETQAERDDPAIEAPDLTWDQELSRWVPAYRQTRWDQAAAEATSSTSLDQPGTGAGYTAVEPHFPAGPVRTIPAWRLTAAHVLLIDGIRVPLAVVDAGDDGQVIARPADGGWHHRFETYDGVQVEAGPMLGEEAVQAEAVRILDSYFRLTLRIDLDEDIPAAAEEIAEMVAAAEQRGAEKWKGIAERGQATVRRVAGLLDAFDGFAHDGDEAEDATDCPRCIVDAFTAALDGSR